MAHGIVREVSRVFADHGFAVVPSVLKEKALASAKEAVGIIERSVGDLHPGIVSQLFVLETATPATELTDPPHEVLFIASDPPRFHPELVEVLTDPFVIRLTHVLLGVEEIQYHFGNITTKVPGLGTGDLVAPGQSEPVHVPATVILPARHGLLGRHGP